MSDATEALAVLRTELQDLLRHARTVDLPTAPLKLEDHPDGPLRLWHVGDLRVLTVPEGERCVFLSALKYISMDPDWYALSTAEARELGTALLAAANDAEADPRFRRNEPREA